MLFKFFKSRRYKNLDPDEILLDASNLPSFDKQQFEGQLERPISKASLYVAGLGFLAIIVFLAGRVGYLEILRGEAFAARSESNSLRHTPIFAERGIIYDRNGEELAWNAPERTYISKPGLAHVLGFVGYPNEDDASKKDFDHKEVIGREGVERAYNDILDGEKGIKIEEADVTGNIISDHLLKEPQSGESLTLSVDSKLQGKLYELIKDLAIDKDFKAGAGVLMDVETGELLAITSYPEYDPNLVAVGKDQGAIRKYLNDPQSPFLNRAISGIYTPGSIFKTIMAAGALNEKIISPSKIIVSTGKLTIPNPYDPKNPSIFKDWKAHGAVDMRRALAVSSNVYFYVLGGGFAGQEGLGVSRIDKYAKLFGLGAPTGIVLGKEASGVIPTPEWKKENFNGEDWRLGDTYHSSIGQYGFLVTPIQMVRVAAAVANNGRLLTPTVLKNEVLSGANGKDLGLRSEDLQIIKEGMRGSVTEGTAQGLSVPYVRMAAKTGTAELGTAKERVNAWIIGFFPYDKPKYAFAVVMERGHRENVIGGVFITRQLIDWMHINTPEYLNLLVASST